MQRLSRVAGAGILAAATFFSGGLHAQSVEACAAPNGESHLFIYPTGTLPDGVAPSACKDPSCSPYTGANTDGWLTDSWTPQGGDVLGLTLANQDTNTNAGDVLLVIALHGGTTAEQFQGLTISGGAGGTVNLTLADFGNHPNNPFAGSGSHGVYAPSGDAIYAFYRVGALAHRNAGSVLGGTVQLILDAATNGSPDLDLHFDAFDCTSGLKNAFSSDATWVGPGCSLSIVCPAPATVECNAGAGSHTFAPPSVENTCPDEETVTSTAQDSYAYACPGPASTTVTFTATNDEHTVSCDTSVTVVDTTAPTIDCVNQELVAGPNCEAVAAGASAGDSCDGTVQTRCDARVVTGVGMHGVGCEASDCAGNTARCTAEVVVRDTTPPSISCSGAQVIECAGPCNTAADVSATAHDNCDAVNAACDAPNAYCLGATTVNCTATDNSGNPASCATTVTVMDTLPPSAECSPSQVVVTSQQGGLCRAALVPSINGADTCEGALAGNCSPAALELTAAGTASSACSVTDSSGNATGCGTTLVLVDDTPPTIECPAPVTVFADASCTASAAISANASDNCDGSTGASCQPDFVLLTAPGSVNATCSITDASGNSAGCATTVTMVDATPPALNCPAPIVVSAGPSCGADITPEATAADNCSGAVAAECSGVSIQGTGSATSTCTASDADGNTASCTTTVTVVDDTAPVLTLGTPSGAVGNGAFCNDAPVVIPFTLSDNCACTTFSISSSVGTVAFNAATMSGTVTIREPINGTLDVQITAADCAGNVATVTTEVAFQTCFCTYTQGGWGAGCSGNNPGCIRDAGFASVYPAGMTFGGNGSPHTVRFTSSAAVDAFLPAGGTAGVLTASATNPRKTAAGVLGGQLSAAHLTVDFDDAGLLNRVGNTPVGDLVVTTGPFAGMTLRALVSLADKVVGGNTAALPAGTNISALNAALDSVNRNFDNCVSSNGFLRR